MAIFVINEWLWHDSSGENGLDHQQQALKVITTLSGSEHQIVIIEGSPFDQKAWSLWKVNAPSVRGLAQVFFTNDLTP